MKIRLINSLIFAFIFFQTSPSFAQEWSKEIVPGIKYLHIKNQTDNGFLHIHVLKIDLKNPKINIKPELANGTIGNLEKTSDIALRNNAVCAINGSFFENRKKLHLPLGLMIIDGRVVSKSILERAAIGITKEKEIVFGMPKVKGYAINLSNKKSVPIWGINRPRKKDEVIIYTNEYGDHTRTNSHGKEIVVSGDGNVISITNGNSKIPEDGFVVSLHGWSRDLIQKTRVGDKIGLVYDLDDKWKNVKQAVTGGPLLVKDGEIVHEESLVNEKFKKDILPANSRTAVGITKNNELIFTVVDKQYPVSTGVTYDQLSRIMKDMGSSYAIGLDGGHTSTMYINGRVVNFPLYQTEAKISNAIIVQYDGWKISSKPKIPYIYKYVYKPPSDELIEALKGGADLAPTTYIPRPEDFGLYGLYDLYNRVVPSALKSSFSL